MPQGPKPLPGVEYVIAVGSGKGGVGKTTVAVIKSACWTPISMGLTFRP